MRKINFLVVILTLSILTACRKELNPGAGQPSDLSSTQAVGNSPQEIQAGDEFVPNEIIVKFKPGVSDGGRANAFSKISAKAKEHIHTVAMQRAGDNEGVFLVETPNSVEAAIATMKALGEVEYAEPNYIYKHTDSYTANDNCYLRLPGTSTNLWGMYSNDQPNPVGPQNSSDGTITGFLTTSTYGTQAEKAWAAGYIGSSDVVVGVIDEGIYWNHDDFKHLDPTTGTATSTNIENTKPNDPYPSTGSDPYPNDLYGWNFVNNTNQVYTTSQDQHGTHVAGTIGAVGGNTIAVAGICWNVKIISAKFLSPNGGTTANAIKAVDYFTDLKTQLGLNIVATNNSWGGGGYSQALYDAIQRANSAGILFVTAAGNSGVNIDKRASYPASYTNPNVVAVAAINSSGALSSWSNYGAKTVLLGAPGEWIYSTYPPADDATGYHPLSGTSMATPHVTGAVALYLSKNYLSTGKYPTTAADAAAVKTALLNSTTYTSSLNGKTKSNGRLDVNKLLGLP